MGLLELDSKRSAGGGEWGGGCAAVIWLSTESIPQAGCSLSASSGHLENIKKLGITVCIAASIKPAGA